VRQPGSQVRLFGGEPVDRGPLVCRSQKAGGIFSQFKIVMGMGASGLGLDARGCQPLRGVRPQTLQQPIPAGAATDAGNQRLVNQSRQEA